MVQSENEQSETGCGMLYCEGTLRARSLSTRVEMRGQRLLTPLKLSKSAGGQTGHHQYAGRYTAHVWTGVRWIDTETKVAGSGDTQATLAIEPCRYVQNIDLNP